MSAVYAVYMEGEFLFGAECGEPTNYVDLDIPCKSETDESCGKNLIALWTHILAGINPTV
jgi:hypothetical protein